MKRTIGAFVVAGCLAAGAPASARDGWNAAGVALGAAGGLALGSALAAPRPVYTPVYPTRPAYVESVEEEPVCHVRRTRYVDEYGDVTIRRVRVLRMTSA